jgi:hypothetical protein
MMFLHQKTQMVNAAAHLYYTAQSTGLDDQATVQLKVLLSKSKQTMFQNVIDTIVLNNYRIVLLWSATLRLS